MKPSTLFDITLEAAHRYERVTARHILSPWAPSLVDAARVAEGERVLDLACGTGVVARIAAQRAAARGQVTGVDLNAGMIAVARSLPHPEGAPIEWLEGSALSIPLRDAAMSVVLCQQGFQFFPDRPLAMREMHRVLERGGRLALSVWAAVGIYNSAVIDALARFAGEDIATRFRASRNVPAAQELERLATAAGLAEVNVKVSRMNIHLPRLDRFVLEHLAGTPVAEALAAIDEEAREKIGASVARALRSYEEGDGVTYPEEIHVLTARA